MGARRQFSNKSVKSSLYVGRVFPIDNLLGSFGVTQHHQNVVDEFSPADRWTVCHIFDPLTVARYRRPGGGSERHQRDPFALTLTERARSVDCRAPTPFTIDSIPGKRG